MISTKISEKSQSIVKNGKVTCFQENFENSIYNIIPITSLNKQKFETLSFPQDLVVSYEEDYNVYECEDYVFIRFAFDELKYKGLENATFKIYEKIFSELNKRNLQFLRVWNYIPNILMHEELERYRLFNKGRWKAWQQFGPWDKFDQPIRPAATVIGAENGPLIIEVLFTRHQVTYLENPRQTQFIHYSSKWGPKPPIAARGTLHTTPEYEELYISGTASLLGEEVAHIGDPENQTIETLKNIKVLISRENLKKYNTDSHFELKDLKAVRVYIKEKAHYEIVKKVVESHITSKDILYLRDDICRPGFLVEIEGLARK